MDFIECPPLNSFFFLKKLHVYKYIKIPKKKKKKKNKQTNQIKEKRPKKIHNSAIKSQQQHYHQPKNKIRINNIIISLKIKSQQQHYHQPK
jgi:hypothetical protein